MPVYYLDRVDPYRSHESERRPVTHCQAVSETAGSNDSCVQCDIFWPAVHETPTVVAQDQRVLPEEPASHAQGHEAMPTCLRHVEETLVLVRGVRCDVQNMVCTVIIRVGSDSLWGHLARGVFTPQTRFKKKKSL